MEEKIPTLYDCLMQGRGVRNKTFRNSCGFEYRVDFLSGFSNNIVLSLEQGSLSLRVAEHDHDILICPLLDSIGFYKQSQPKSTKLPEGSYVPGGSCGRLVEDSAGNMTNITLTDNRNRQF